MSGLCCYLLYLLRGYIHPRLGTLAHIMDLAKSGKCGLKLSYLYVACLAMLIVTLIEYRAFIKLDKMLAGINNCMGR